MRTIAIICLCAALSTTHPVVSNAQDEAPAFFTSPKADAAQLASAVNQFVEMGEIKALRALKKIRDKQTFSGKVDGHFRLACICRVLWQNSDHPIPPPRIGSYGGGVSIGSSKSAKLKDWPLYPVAKAGDSYFVVVYGGRGGTGTSHRLPLEYFEQCKKSGSFLSEEIPVPQKRDGEADATKLRQSARWQKEFPKLKDERNAWSSIAAQIPNHGN